MLSSARLAQHIISQVTVFWTNIAVLRNTFIMNTSGWVGVSDGAGRGLGVDRWERGFESRIKHGCLSSSVHHHHHHSLVTLSSTLCSLDQPFSIFLPWRNPWNNCQVSGNPCIKIIISTAHGTLTWSVSCRYNNPIIIVHSLLSRELYFSVDLFILANKFKKRCLFYFQSRSLAEPRFRNPDILVDYVKQPIPVAARSKA
jgi:hypothetical protein